MAAKKILLLTGDFAEDYETMVPFQAMQMIGHTVHAVAPGRTAGYAIKTAIHDFEGDHTYTEKPGHKFTLNFSFDDVDVSKYDGLIIAGGRAPEYIRLIPRVLEIVREFVAASKPIASVCHGVQVLTAADVIRGKTISGYPACLPEIELAGANMAEISMEEAYTDGQFVTAPAWTAHAAWLSQFLQKLGTEIKP